MAAGFYAFGMGAKPLPGLWLEHQQAPFPASCVGRRVDGLPLTRVDAEAGAILTAAYRTDGAPRPLSERQRGDLERALGHVRRALEQGLPDGEARAYFDRVDRLGRLLLGVE